MKKLFLLASLLMAFGISADAGGTNQGELHLGWHCAYL